MSRQGSYRTGMAAMTVLSVLFVILRFLAQWTKVPETRPGRLCYRGRFGSFLDYRWIGPRLYDTVPWEGLDPDAKRQ
jgi:hypothetical protein